MADNPRYQNAGIGLMQMPVIRSVDPTASRAQAAAYGDMSAMLDRMAGSLYKDAAEEAQRQGMMWGAQNPVTVDQLNAAVASGDDPLASRFTYFGQAARKVQATVLGSNLNAQGVNEMSRIQAAVEIGQMPLSAAAEKMDAVSNAYAQTLAQVDPETGIKLRASLTAHSASVYKHLAGEEVKKFTAAQKATIDDWFAKLPKNMEVLYLAGDQTGADGIVKTADDLAQVQRAQAVQAARITGDATYGKDFDKVQQHARVSAYTKLLSDTSYAKDPATALSRIEAGDIGGDYKATWERMSEEEKTKVKENVVKAYAQRYEVITKTNKFNEEQAKDQSRALEIEFYSPGTTGKRKAEILKEVRALGVISPSEYKTMVKGDDEGDPGVESRIGSMIYRGEITTEAQLNAAVPNGKMRNRLRKEMEARLDHDKTEARLIIQEAVAGTRSSVAVLNSQMDAERLNMVNRLNNEEAKAKAEGKPYSIKDIASRISEEYRLKKNDAALKPARDDIAAVEKEISVATGREVTIKGMEDIAAIDKVGGWKDKQKLKDRAIRALRQLNAPVLIPEMPERK